MELPRFAVGVFTVGTPERQATLARAEEKIDMRHPTLVEYQVETDAERRGPWFPVKILLQYFATLDITHAVILQDDVLPCNDFMNVLTKVVQAKSTEAICLYSASHAACDALKKDLSWYTSLNGAVQFVLPVGLIAEFLEFVEFACDEEMQKDLGEDGMINLWAMCTDRDIWHTAVSVLDHQNPPSLVGNDEHKFRRPMIRPYEDMSGLNWNTGAIDSGVTYRTYWGLALLTPEAKEKYAVHEKMYKLHKRCPYGSR